MWYVKLRGITWDDGKGEYDVSKLPRDVDTAVSDAAADRDEALEMALDEVSEAYCTLVEGFDSYSIQRVGE